MAQVPQPHLESASHRPYADSVDSNHGAAQSWLVKFLRNGCATRRWEQRRPYMRIHILDSYNSVLSGQDFKVHRSAEVDTSFLFALNTRPSTSKTRLIMVQSGQLGDTNGAYIDALGWHYQLNPLFFCTYFQHTLYLTERPSYLTPILPTCLPSENDYITIYTDEYSYMTATILYSGEQTTVIILGVDCCLKDRVSKLVEYLLDTSRFSRDATIAADSSPCDYLLHYIKQALNEAADLNNLLNPRELTTEYERKLSSTDWERNRLNYEHLMRSKNSLARHLQQKRGNLTKSGSCLGELIQDYDYLIEQSEEISSKLLGLSQNYTAEKTILEAQKSLQQADAVRRISVIGVVFLPLSFATSFFGMNFAQLGTGSLHIGYFFLAATLSGLIAFLLSASLRPLERFWDRHRKRVGEKLYESREDYSWVTKSMIFWDWIRRKSPLATLIYREWRVESLKFFEDKNVPSEERAPYFRWTVLWRLLRTMSKRAMSKLRRRLS